MLFWPTPVWIVLPVYVVIPVLSILLYAATVRVMRLPQSTGTYSTPAWSSTWPAASRTCASVASSGGRLARTGYRWARDKAHADRMQIGRLTDFFKRRHRAEPQGIHEHLVFTRSDRRLGFPDTRRTFTVLEILLASDQRKAQLRNWNEAYFAAGLLGAGFVGICRRMTQMQLQGIRVTLDDRDAFSHRAAGIRLTCCLEIAPL